MCKTMDAHFVVSRGHSLSSSESSSYFVYVRRKCSRESHEIVQSQVSLAVRGEIIITLSGPISVQPCACFCGLFL